MATFAELLTRYLVVGLVLVTFLTIRGWRYHRPRGIDGVLVLVGAVVLWLPMLLLEVPAFLRERRRNREKLQRLRDVAKKAGQR